MKRPTRIVGVDLSLTSTGIAAIEIHPQIDGDDGHPAYSTVTVERIKSSGHTNATLQDRGDRLREIARQVWLAAFRSDLVVIEGPSLGQQRQAGTHDRHGLWWVTVDTLQRSSIAVAEVPPTLRAKYATGKGNASKDEVLAAVIRRYDPHCHVTGNDEADALILAAMGARHLGHPIDDDAAHRDAVIDRVAWPTTLQAA